MTGILIVVSGPAGAGKDFIIDEFIKTEIASKLKLKKIKTNADRDQRPGEPPDSYNFITSEELDLLASQNELAEEIVFTGYSRKATSKSEVLKLFDDQNLVWRVDPSLASKIAEGVYFEQYFPEHSATLKESTLLIHIHAPQHIIERRRKERDQHKYIAEEYKARDEYERPHLNVLLKSKRVNVVENIEGNISVTLDKISEIVTTHYEKIKQK